MTVIELVEFRKNDTTTDEALKQAWTQSNAFISAQPGFVGRRLVKGTKDTWVDVVEWQNMSLAKDAFAKFEPQNPDLSPLMAAIDPQSLKMDHFEVTETA